MVKALLERLADADGGFLFPVSGLFLYRRTAVYPGGFHPPGSSPLSCRVLSEPYPGLLLRSSSRDGPGRYGTAASCPMRLRLICGKASIPCPGRLLSHVRGCFRHGLQAFFRKTQGKMEDIWRGCRGRRHPAAGFLRMRASAFFSHASPVRTFTRIAETTGADRCAAARSGCTPLSGHDADRSSTMDHR